MAARARHVNSESAASERLMRDALKSSAINRNEVAFSALPRRLIEKVPNPPQIPFTFLAYISDSDHRPPELNAGRLRCTEGPKQGNNSATIVGNSGKKQD